MKTNYLVRWLAAGTALLALAANTHAAGLPAGLPQAFDWTGPIDAIRLSDDMIVINDRTFVLSRSTRLHGISDRSSLTKGATVGVMASMQDERKVVQDLWVLPDGYQEP